ncbi:helix-turn-helix transcriptional regulator [Kitasatospora sp. NPDC093558]|uniref:helix-turn-helix transcriptional regulator n=1 Tax=Kitasatospora sp. NPDC093558 TaxID=3155201 RepID=UPI00342421F7
MLTAFGIDAVSDAVYRTMLAHPGEDVETVAAHLELDVPSVRAALASLSQLALLQPSNSSPDRLRAVSPDLGMEILLTRQQASIAAQQQRLEAARAAAAQLIAQYSDLRPKQSSPAVEQLIGLGQIRDRLADLSREIETEVMTFAPGGGHDQGDLAASRPLNESLLARGVRIRTVYLDSVRNHAATLEHVHWISEHGGQVRTAPTLPTRMIIVDRARALIPVSSDDATTGAVLLSGQGTLTALCALFEGVWDHAQPLGQEAVRDRNDLTSQEATVIKLLSDGHTDEAISKRLGVSPRTARRITSDLLERLDARSRFQAGANAVRRGWLPPH